MARPDNPRFPHTCEIFHEEYCDDPLEDEYVEVTIYNGCCRSSAKFTTNDTGEVITSTRRLSIPLNLKDWKQLCVSPKVGDRVVVDKDEVAMEYGRIIDFLPNNLGTTILYKYIRN
ncbi:MAG: hypothetical protein IJJ56_06970 [Prevotella sp.]|nr:hypothetical protein [Prevotella sp.]